MVSNTEGNDSVMLNSFVAHTPRLKIAGLANSMLDAEDDLPVVIAVHGWLDNAASFIPLAGMLKTNCRFYAMELPGHGLSEHRPEGSNYHLLDNILDVLAFAEIVSPNKPVVLLGHSLGGIVCSLVAASAPDRVHKLILLDSLGPLTDELSNVLPQLRKAVRKATMFKPSKLTVYADLDHMIAVRMKGIGHITREAATLLVHRGAKQVEGGWVWTSDPRLMAPSLMRLSEAQVEHLFSGVECEVCLICGSGGYFNDYTRLSKRLGYIARLEKFHVNGGHHFHMEGDVHACADKIERFLECEHDSV